METHQNTKELLTAAATLWAAHHTARAAAPNGQLRPTGWLKLIWSHRKILAAGLTGLSSLPAEAADFTAAELGCSRRTVQYMIERGDLKAHRPALLRYAIYRRDLDAYKRAHGMS